MTTQPFQDRDVEDCMHAAVDRGEFATVEEARADFNTSMEEAIADCEAGRTEDIEVVFARLRALYTDMPRAAE